MSEREEILAKWNQTLREFRENYLSWEKGTLKNYLLKCAELIELQIEYQIINIRKDQISSYLFSQLQKEGIQVSDRWIQLILPDEYKRNYSKTEVPSESPIWTVISDAEDLIEKNQYGEFRINGVEVTERLKKTEGVIKTWDSADEEERIEDDYTKFLNLYSLAGTTIANTFEALRNKYFQNQEAKKIIQEYYSDIKKSTEELLQIVSKLRHAKSLVDDRQRWGEYEKILMNFLIKTGETIAHLAKAVGYCSKYGSVGIDRNPDLDFTNNEELKKFLRACPRCKSDIADILNENLQKYHLGQELEIVTPKI